MRLTLLLGLALCVACGPDSQNSLFGAGTQGQTAGATASATASGTGSTGSPATSTSGGEGSAEGVSADPTTPASSEGSGDTGSPTTGVEPGTTSTTSPPTSGDDTSTTGAGEESSSSTSTGAGEEEDDGGMDAGTQPGDGMYAPCTVPRDCGFAPELCITLSDADGVVLDGFCSETTCNNPVADCDAAPGAAPTACLDVTVDGAADSACVLDCTGGETCPAGMTCYALTGISICG